MIQGLARLHEWVLVADARDEVVWVSDALASMFGGSRALLGRPWLGEWVEPLEAERVQASLAQAGRITNEPIRLHAPGTDALDASLAASQVGPPGACRYTIAIFRMASEDASALQREIGFTSAILDSAPEGVVVIDRSRFITYANPAMSELTGYAVAELVDRPLVVFLSGQLDFERIATTLSEEPSLSHGVELDVRRRDGSPLTVHVQVKVLQLPDGSQIGAVAYVRDVTELRGAQRELERKNAELEHYVNAVSHDLRSPLVAMLGFSRLLREDYADVLGDRGDHFLRRIEEAGRTMEGLLQDLLELSRIGRTELVRQPVDPRQILLQLEAELKPRADAAGVRLKLPAAPPILLCDRTQLYQVLSNLIRNGIEHMGDVPNACIEVEIEPHERGHRITARDNGQGVPTDEHGRIFEIFHSLSPNGHEGTGIGLAVVKKIAVAHGGDAWVESTPGQGAAFHATFAGS